MNTPVIAQMAVIANEVTQSMTADCMDRHGLRPRDDGVGSWSVCSIGGLATLCGTARFDVDFAQQYSAQQHRLGLESSAATWL